MSPDADRFAERISNATCDAHSQFERDDACERWCESVRARENTGKPRRRKAILEALRSTSLRL
jgi:hypothetical protein